ncbi:MAG: VWA-like domain-containing protein [Gammaproteobacteria bacterium]|nr:VWA-like domain-containing protein [Gammaproteobacteria bacterium]
MRYSRNQRKLATARTRLILDKPFLGALVLRLPLVAANPGWCKTTASDARKLYFNHEYIDSLDIQETQFVLAKQALHCALSHFARRQHRIQHRWDLACDYAVNPLLIHDGLKPPPGTLTEDRYEGMTAEEIYHFIDDFDNESSEHEKPSQERAKDGDRDPLQNEGDQHRQPQESRESGPDDEAGKTHDLAPRPDSLTSQQQEEMSIQWQQRLAGAAQQAMQAGKLGGSMARMVDFMLQPKLPWRMLLAKYLTANAREDYSYSRPSSRRGNPAIYPSLRSSQVNVAVGIDISGSVSDQDMNEFLSEVDAIKGNMRARITLLPCDSELTEGAPWIFEPWDDIKMPSVLKGGGGTSFCPVFKWLDLQDQYPDLLVYFTDCQGTFPETAPCYPVIWLVKGKKPAPWGQRIQLN